MEKLNEDFEEFKDKDDEEMMHFMSMILEPLVNLIKIGLDKDMEAKELAKYTTDVLKKMVKEMEGFDFPKEEK